MDDRVAVEAVRAGEHQAYGALASRYRGKVLQLCYHMTGDAFEAEDLAHDAFVEAFLKLHQLKNPDRFFPWLKTVTLNLCRMWYRERRNKPIDPASDEEIQAIPGQHTEFAASSEADGTAHTRVAYGLSQLSVPHRMTLVLHYWEGLSYEEIASFLDLPIGTVMSRLHRARHALKGIMDARPSQEIPMIPDEVFRQEVEAEIETLLEAFHEDRAAMERLSVILKKSPERLTQFIRDAHDDSTLARLALLLHRLDASAVQLVLNAALNGEPQLREQAAALLARWIATHTKYRPGPARHVHVLLDTLIQASVPDSAKVALLIALLQASQSGPTVPLLASVLLCYPEAAFPRLMERFWELGQPDRFQQHEHLLSTLCRTGTWFGKELLDALASEDVPRQALVLAGLECLSRVFQRQFLPNSARFEDASPEQISLTTRFGCWNVPPIESGREPAILERMVTEVVPLVQHARDDFREPAIRILGGMAERNHLDKLHAALKHGQSSTRMAAILSLGDIGAEESATPLAAVALDATKGFTERRAAIDSLARLSSEESEEMVLQLLDDPDAQIVRIAIGAISIPPTERASAKLEALVSSRDRNVVKAAAKVLYAQRKRRPRSETTEKRLSKIRGDETPNTFVSTEVAIRALPETRAYDEKELTRLIAGVCHDYSTTRRFLVMEGKHSLMTRDNGIYELTDLGKLVWRVEHFIMHKYLA